MSKLLLDDDDDDLFLRDKLSPATGNKLLLNQLSDSFAAGDDREDDSYSSAKDANDESATHQ